jgi:S1-C subfamily serine protease
MKPPHCNPLTCLGRSLLVLFVLSNSGLATEPTKEIIQQVQRSVVVVNTYDAEGRALTIGSGFFIEHNRLITNIHVIKNASQATIRTSDGRIYSVQGVLALNEENDLALLQTSVPIDFITVLSVAQSYKSEGESVTVISAADDSSWKISTGMTAAVWYIKAGQYIRITAEICRGNSGSPVVNEKGQVIGVAALHLDGSDNLNFAVPGELIKLLRPGPLKPLPGAQRAGSDKIIMPGIRARPGGPGTEGRKRGRTRMGSDSELEVSSASLRL